MSITNKPKTTVPSGVASEGTWPGLDSRFRLIIVAGKRTKQLLHGSTPRIEVDTKRRRNTSIALEEVKRGLIQFERVNRDGTPLTGDGLESARSPFDRDLENADVRVARETR